MRFKCYPDMKSSHYAFVLWLTILTTKTTICTIDDTTKKDDSTKSFQEEKLSTFGINPTMNSNSTLLESTLIQIETNRSNLQATPIKALHDSIKFNDNSSIEVSTNGHNGTNCDKSKCTCAIIIFISSVIIYNCFYHLSFMIIIITNRGSVVFKP